MTCGPLVTVAHLEGGMDRDDVIERLAMAIYYAQCDLNGYKGARWSAVDPHHKETVWKAKAIQVLA